MNCLDAYEFEGNNAKIVLWNPSPPLYLQFLNFVYAAYNAPFEVLQDSSLRLGILIGHVSQREDFYVTKFKNQNLNILHRKVQILLGRPQKSLQIASRHDI
jgi:hypothetical protein